MSAEHPTLKQFRSSLTEAREGKLTDAQLRTKGESFGKWRANAAKCAPGSEVRIAADALWQQYEDWLAQPHPAPQPSKETPPTPTSDRRGSRTRPSPRGPAPQRGDHAGAADPACLGAAFYNPYTFVPFPHAGWFAHHRARRAPTPLTIDEVDPQRFTGVLDLEVLTLSPLLTCSPVPVRQQDEHKQFRALASGSDVIVPATGVRGALRSLLTILAGGTLGYLDDTVWLVQGRDLALGPKGKASPPSVPEQYHLARVEQQGSFDRAGSVRLGHTRLVKADDLEALSRKAGLGDLPRPARNSDEQARWCDEAHGSMRNARDATHCWQLKLSGPPVNTKGKREGSFLDDGAVIELPPQVWAEYLGRNRHGEHQELRTGDLVWLEPTDPNCKSIVRAEDVRSIQWARWGRRGEKLLDVVTRHHSHMLPDALNRDGLVDEVTDLFGQVPHPHQTGAAGPFAARIRPENLVFFDAASEDGIERAVPLAPLAPPHPGCAAFYRDCDDLDLIANHGLPLRGYKVYRTTIERGEGAPWRYATQGVYGESGRSSPPRQRVNKTCDLLREGRVGRLRIACRGLSRRELALLLAAASVDWRLGGGKPLGLGHCRVQHVRAIDEVGKEVVRFERNSDARPAIPEPYASEIRDIESRIELWERSQRPVTNLRYPRAASENQNRKQRGGHVWFQRHANPRKATRNDGPPTGLQVLWTTGSLREQAGGADRIGAQALRRPRTDGGGEELFGFDLFAPEAELIKESNHITRVGVLTPFDDEAHARASDRSGGPQAPNRESRRRQREQRGGPPRSAEVKNTKT